MYQPTDLYDKRFNKISLSDFLISPFYKVYLVIKDADLGIAIEHIHTKTREKLTPEVAGSMNVIRV